MTDDDLTAHDDRGFTLVEVTVGMVILTLFLAIFTGTMVNMFHSVYRTQQTADAQQGANIAFIRLERQIRYADGISNVQTTGANNANYTVLFSDTWSGTQVCTQLLYAPASDTLSERSWKQDANGNPTTWIDQGSALAADVNVDPLQTAAADSTDQTVSGAPFATFPAYGSQNNQRLEISVNVRDSSQVTGTTTRVRHLDVTFAALNTSLTTSSATVCSAGVTNTNNNVQGWSWPSKLIT